MINETYLHLLLNHVPVLTSLLGIPLFFYGWLRKDQRVLQIGLGSFILAALSAVPVYFSGEGAEEMVEHLPGVLESLIESHEDVAKIAMILAEALGLSALVAFVLDLRQSDLSKWSLPVVALISLISAGAIIQTAHLGGQIRHSEIRTNTASSFNNAEKENGSEALNKQKQEEDHDDD